MPDPLLVLAPTRRDAETAMRGRGVPSSWWLYVSQWGHIRGRIPGEFVALLDTPDLSARTRVLEYRAYLRSTGWAEIPLDQVVGR